MSAIADAGMAGKDTGGPIRRPRGRGHGLLGRVPEGFAVFFGVLGLLCALLALIPPLRTGLRPLVRFLDLMRRDRTALNGVMEFMVAELCHAAPKLGVRKVSLNFAVFRSVFEEGARIGAGPVLRLWRRLLLFFSKWWQLEALYRSNAKYRPEWYPRFLCYTEAASLARVGLASGIAEGFVSVPSMRKLWGRGHPKGGQRPVTTEGLPSLAALGLAGGDGTEPAGPLSGLSDQVRVRHRKLDRLRAAGTDPYPVGIPARTHTLAGIRQGEDVCPHRYCDRVGVPYTADDGPGDVVLEMYERLVEERTQLPTFYKDFPTDVSPLTRQHRTDPRLAERWDLVAFGTELGTACSELTDPVEQRRRLTAQSLLAAGATPRRWNSTRTSWTPSNTPCRPPAASASASTGWSCSSPD
ncbi:hypothetical protein GCM10010313_07720 [Streptomyces violarus]|uniref:Uncharacterized protein n=1 Tax=Streptomyces violarus TaxID=67380 RepID=A0A7W4ZKQ3_9ACTN|nr:hypothetical protein [Streptomyces violarus]GHC98601.1 hypothetical protein GCM10010313_07720 [Streptomyces violarus]